MLELGFDQAAVPSQGRVIDPFAGAATVGTFAVTNGARFAGLEAHPLIAELGALKFSARPRGDLERALDDVLGRPATLAQLADEHELVCRSFGHEALRVLAGVRNQLGNGVAGSWSGVIRWALIGALRETASIKTGWPYQRPALTRAPLQPNVADRIRERARWIAEDMSSAPSGRGRVVLGDSRVLGDWRTLPKGGFHACVSSPPYLNNFDYADATRLELYFLKEAASWSEMCSRHRRRMVVATTQQSSNSEADAARVGLEELAPTTASAVELLVHALQVERAKRPRGKEYDRLVQSYFGDLSKVLVNLRTRLASGAKVAWVVGDSAPYGIYIDTPGLLLILAEEVGYVPISTSLVRHRGKRWRTNGSRHQVPLHEQMIVFAAPRSLHD